MQYLLDALPNLWTPNVLEDGGESNVYASVLDELMVVVHHELGEQRLCVEEGRSSCRTKPQTVVADPETIVIFPQPILGPLGLTWRVDFLVRPPKSSRSWQGHALGQRDTSPGGSACGMIAQSATACGLCAAPGTDCAW